MNEQSNNTRLGDVAYVVRSVEGATAIARGNITNSKMSEQTINGIGCVCFADLRGGRREMSRLTPETDAFWQNDEYEALRDDHKISRWSDFARRLERQRDEAREKAERYRIEANAMMMQRDEWAAMCGRYKQERDEALMDRANGDIATMTRNHYERILRERDEAREQIDQYRDKLDLTPINWDI